ncbi:50S ribosomal protein L21, mitochondrial [Phalaenopsis equestris]|uniref:50S ribosomal protein L21, mitochondrial n=1 Tax=Phalaenopsis equestris TaxID=78828 RepID=UPI0009E38CFC|nr:50S ribosomal protein L21, mitochondrial [Phalaenopsis equestris]
MATRRLLGAVARPLRFSNQPISSLPNFGTLTLRSKLVTFSQSPPSNTLNALAYTSIFRCFSSRTPDYSGSEDDDEEEEDDEGEVEDSCDEEDGSEAGPKLVAQGGKSEAEKLEEAASIGYKVIGPLTPSENPFKPYEPVFAVVQIGSHQFKVSNGDSIFAERLKYCEVNDKLILSKVLMLGSRTETIIGRPILPDAAVHAVVEEHALDAKVIIFKKKRRKNYRRTKGHRQVTHSPSFLQ